MKNCRTRKSQTARRILLSACATALAVAFTAALPQPAHAGHVTPPPVPEDLKVPAGNEAYLVGHGVGTQDYICLPCPNPTTPAAMCPDATGFAWLLFTPQATLFADNDKQVTTHFFSPNPDGRVRATWQHSRDTSVVWAALFAPPSFDADFVELGAVPWLLLKEDGVQDGPTGGDKLTVTTFVHRLNTSGGSAPSTGCSASSDVGKKAFVPYEADYFFYKAAESDAEDGN